MEEETVGWSKLCKPEDRLRQGEVNLGTTNGEDFVPLCAEQRGSAGTGVAGTENQDRGQVDCRIA